MPIKQKPIVWDMLNMKKKIGWKKARLLGSKDLETNVFRTLMCIVNKPWSKQVV